MSNHQSGTWEFTHSVDKRRGTVFVDGQATICSYGPEDAGYTGTKVANFKLISAAPDMLEALKRALPYLQSDDDDGSVFGRMSYNEVLKLVNKAIAKAEGK